MLTQSSKFQVEIVGGSDGIEITERKGGEVRQMTVPNDQEVLISLIAAANSVYQKKDYRKVIKIGNK